MVRYELDHLTQAPAQYVIGPIQDDEALFLFALVRGSRMTRVLEIGGLNGYSATNFLAAMRTVHPDGAEGVMYTVDTQPVAQMAPNHRVIQKDALHLAPEDVDGRPVDLVFFDCHSMAQMDMYERFAASGIIDERTVLALHDTNLHYEPWGLRQGPHVHQPSVGASGFAHQPVERAMVNRFSALGYDVFHLRTTPNRHHDGFPFRHGLTVCQKHEDLV